jgi:hypothetical protein
MSGGSVTGNSGGGVYVYGSGAFTMSNDARIDPSNEVCLGYNSYDGNYAGITLAGDLSGSDTVAVVDLYGDIADWLGKFVLLRDAGSTGTIPVDRFSLGNFVSYDYYSGITNKTPLTNYILNSEGRLVNK